MLLRFTLQQTAGKSDSLSQSSIKSSPNHCSKKHSLWRYHSNVLSDCFVVCHTFSSSFLLFLCSPYRHCRVTGCYWHNHAYVNMPHNNLSCASIALAVTSSSSILPMPLKASPELRSGQVCHTSFASFGSGLFYRQELIKAFNNASFTLSCNYTGGGQLYRLLQLCSPSHFAKLF